MNATAAAEHNSRSITLSRMTFMSYGLNLTDAGCKEYVAASPFAAADTHPYLASAAILTKSSVELAAFFGISEVAATNMRDGAGSTVVALQDAMPLSGGVRDEQTRNMISELVASIFGKPGASDAAAEPVKASAEEKVEPGEASPKIKAIFEAILAGALSGKGGPSGAFEVDLKTGKITPLTGAEAAEAITAAGNDECDCPSCRPRATATRQ